MKAVVTGIRPEAPRSVTLRFDVPGGFHHAPGQYIEIDPHQFPALAGAVGPKDGPRAFSISDDLVVEISVKDNPRSGPYSQLLSPYLVNQVKVGDAIEITGPKGKYVYPDSLAGISTILHLCAGSGIAPNRALIRHALAQGWSQQHLLIHQNRTPEDVFYKTEWPALVSSGRLTIRDVFSGQSHHHADASMVSHLDPASTIAFVCGPSGFVKQWKGTLGAMGIRTITEY